MFPPKNSDEGTKSNSRDCKFDAGEGAALEMALFDNFFSWLHGSW